MKEIRKDVKNYKGLYQISNYGNIKSLNYGRTGKIKNIKQRIDKYGYSVVDLHKKGVRKSFFSHRLVCFAFLGEPNIEQTQVNHKNGIKIDNRLCNLERCTNSQNQIHKYYVLGNKKNKESKLKKTKFKKPVVVYSLNGNKIGEFTSIFDGGQLSGINVSNIKYCCMGKRKTAGGYIWKYKTD